MVTDAIVVILIIIVISTICKSEGYFDAIYGRPDNISVYDVIDDDSEMGNGTSTYDVSETIFDETDLPQTYTGAYIDNVKPPGYRAPISSQLEVKRFGTTDLQKILTETTKVNNTKPPLTDSFQHRKLEGFALASEFHKNPLNAPKIINMENELYNML